MYCQAITPDGRLLEFDDILVPGQVVHDEYFNHYVVGPDLGNDDPFLCPLTHAQYMRYWRHNNRTVQADQRGC